ncbi:hypothetical protein CDAR_76371 [Caerostris darwini]|uniref:Secreted protein n=1 Tax=Caerostris darwini TaxID=1538125 RepID=A0AAV4PAJ3_9ARAC|nr:hypothetical protein CDAR_76371 [Caerostris darwini]
MRTNGKEQTFFVCKFSYLSLLLFPRSFCFSLSVWRADSEIVSNRDSIARYPEQTGFPLGVLSELKTHNVHRRKKCERKRLSINGQTCRLCSEESWKSFGWCYFVPSGK